MKKSQQRPKTWPAGTGGISGPREEAGHGVRGGNGLKIYMRVYSTPPSAQDRGSRALMAKR